MMLSAAASTPGASLALLQLARAACVPLAARLTAVAARRSLWSSCTSACGVLPCPLAEPAPETDASPASFSIPQFSRSQHPPAVWDKALSLLSPLHTRRQPVAVDLAVGAPSSSGTSSSAPAALELAARGLNVLGVSCGASPAARATQLLLRGNPTCLGVDVVAAQLLDPSVLKPGAADLVTLTGGVHLLDLRAALQEAHRLLRPGGRLLVALSDRDLSSWWVDELEEVMEAHVPGYRRAAAQHAPAAWAGMLRLGGAFRLLEYSTHRHLVALAGGEELCDALEEGSFLPAGALMGAAGEDLQALAECRFGAGPVALPLESRVFVLEKAVPRPNQ